MTLQRRFLSTVLLMGVAGLANPGIGVLGQQAPAHQEEVIERFRAAQEDMQAGRFESAIAGFKEVLQRQPDLVEARVDLGRAYHAFGDYDQAVAELARAVQQRPDSLPTNLFLGLSYLKLGFPEKAIIPLNRVLALDPSQPEARRALANAELSVGQYGHATMQFRWLAGTQKAEAWFTLGKDYLEMATQLTAELSVQFHDSAWSVRLAGDLLSQRGLWNDAASAYRKALQADPGQAGLHSTRGEALLCGGKAAEAEAELQAELSRNPFDSPALLGMAEVQLHKGAAQQAIEPLSQIWKFSPDVLAQAWPDFPAAVLAADAARQLAAQLGSVPPSPAREFLLSALLRVAGDNEGANQERARFANEVKSATVAEGKSAPLSRSACEAHQERLCAEFLAAEKSLSFPDRLKLGRILLALHQDDAATDALAAALAQNEASPEARYWLDQDYLRLADECFNQLAASYPDYWRAHELKAEAWYLRHDDKDAIAEYQAAARLNPDDPGIHEALGELLLKGNALAEGKSELETALRLNPAAPRSLYLLGRFYVWQKEPEKGIPYLEAALRYDPTLLEARPVLGKAYLKVGKADLAIAQLERCTAMDRYGDLHYFLYQAYREAGKPELAAQALARSQELRRKSAEDDQAKIRSANPE